jgi:hypothetical protein
MQLKYKYFHFSDASSFYPKRKTKTFDCINNKSGAILGNIKWYSNWRQYCFFSSDNTIFNSSCLEDISYFLKQLNNGHKNKSNKRKTINSPAKLTCPKCKGEGGEWFYPYKDKDDFVPCALCKGKGKI